MRPLRLAGALLVSGAAFAALLAGATWNGASAAVAVVPEPPEAPAPAASAPAPAAEAPAPTPTPGDAPVGVEVPEAPAEAPATEEPAGVTVPDFASMNAARATREARRLGLRLDVYHRDGTRVGRYEREEMEIRRTRPAAGAAVEPGSTVLAEARYGRFAYAAGY